MTTISSRISLSNICVLYLIMWTISPFMEINMIWRVLALGAAAVWFLLKMNGSTLSQGGNAKALFFLAAVVMIAFIETISIRGVLRQIALIILVIFYIIFHYYQAKNSLLSLSWFVPVILMLLIFFNFRSGQALATNPRIARLLVRDDEATYAYLRQGIGGYSLIYPQVIIFPALLAWVMRAFRYKKLWFMIGLVWLVTYVRLLLAAGYSIAIAASLIGIFVMFFYKGKNAIGVVVISILLFIVGIMAIVYIAPLRNTLLVIFDGTSVEKKINDLMLSMLYETGQGSIMDRINAYGGSLKTIIRFPIIGGLFWASGGGHSAVLDMFAKYGIWGGTIFTSMIYAVPNYYRKTYGTTSIRSTVNATYATIVFVSIMDSVTYAFMGMLLLILPIVLETMLFWTGEKYEDSLGG